jgi:hypothetical protein
VQALFSTFTLRAAAIATWRACWLMCHVDAFGSKGAQRGQVFASPTDTMISARREDAIDFII